MNRPLLTFAICIGLTLLAAAPRAYGQPSYQQPGAETGAAGTSGENAVPRDPKQESADRRRVAQQKKDAEKALDKALEALNIARRKADLSLQDATLQVAANEAALKNWLKSRERNEPAIAEAVINHLKTGAVVPDPEVDCEDGRIKAGRVLPWADFCTRDADGKYLPNAIKWKEFALPGQQVLPGICRESTGDGEFVSANNRELRDAIQSTTGSYNGTTANAQERCEEAVSRFGDNYSSYLVTKAMVDRLDGVIADLTREIAPADPSSNSD